MKTFGILGSGFGLYGYLPSVINDYKVILPLKAKEIIESRSDIKQYLEKIEFLDNLDSIFNNIDSIIIAKNPIIQESLIPIILKHKNIKNIFLEKPLASMPKIAKNLQKILFKSNANIRIAYIFIYCKWFKILQNLLDSKATKEIKLTWTFKAHHFSHNINSWKKDSKQGGGVLNFYAIHIIALSALFDLKLDKVFFINNECIESSFKKDNILLKIHIDSNSNINIFSIFTDNILLYVAKSPFESSFDNTDSRILLLKKHIDSIKNPNENYYKWYEKVLNLWSEIQKQIL